jgi:hypothetical protein
MTAFDNVDATTDGPDEPGTCDFFSYTQIDADIWYRYTASCTGDVTVSLCGSGYDTKLAVYGDTCPTGASAIACNDDNCGGTTQSELTFSAVAGSEYLIRIGGYNGAMGTGTLTISCASTVECMNPGDCDDGDPCTIDTCDAGNCVHTLLDSDNDGEPDCTDLCPNDPFKTDPGTCGCGHADLPADGDLNEDGNVNSLDAQSMVDGLINGTTTAYNCHGDFNTSGALDAGDIPGLVAVLLAP